jgi:hypothetical protein
MKIYLFSIQLSLTLAACCCAQGQGFVYDQQSATSDSGGNSVTATIQSNEPIGQSFTPSLSSVGFIRLFLFDAVFPNPAGATVFVNLWSGSIDGTLIASADPVFIAPGFDSYENFFFSTSATVNPGTTYYFQLVVQSGDTTRTGIVSSGYTNGTAFFGGVASMTEDLWFREGVVVPEPSSILLSFLGLAGLYLRGRKIQ